MKKTFLIGVVVSMAMTARAQSSSVAGQSIWRHAGPTSVTGQSIWRHQGLPGAVVTQPLRKEVRPRRDNIAFLGIGPTCDAGYDPAITLYAYEESQAFYQPGYQWGTGLREFNLAWADLQPYLEQYLLNASPNAQVAFRRGFVEGFGGNGEALYDRAFRQAARPG